MGRNLKILATILSLSVVYGAYYWGIPAAIKLESHDIEQKIFEQTKIQTKIKNPTFKMGVLPSIWVSTDNFSIINSDKTKALEAVNTKLGIKIIPLIFNKIDIEHLSIENLNIEARYTKDLQFQLGQYDLKLPLKLLNSAKLNIDKYDINLKDEFQQKYITLNGKQLIIKDYKKDKQITFSTCAQLKTDKNISDINANVNLKLPLTKISQDQLEISGYIKNLDLADFSQYAKTLTNNEIKSLSGLINFTAQTNTEINDHKQIKTNLSVKNLGIIKDDIKSSIHFKNLLTIDSDIRTISNGIKICNAKIYGDGVNISSFGEITKLDYKTPNLDLNIAINNSKLDKVLTLLPGEANLTSDADLLVLKQTGLWGNISTNLDIKGKADFPNVYGNVLVNEAYLVKPIQNAPKANIKLDFEGNKFNLDVEVPTSNTQKVWVKGPINLDKERSAELHIKSTDKVDLKTAQIILNPLHKIFHFDIGPVPIMDIKGNGNIDLHVTGTRKNPHGWGEFNFNNATVSFLDINNLLITNGSGNLKFTDQNSYFETNTATLNGSPININGTCTLQGNLDFNVNTNNQNLNALLKTVKTSPMLTEIQKLTEKIENSSGYANLNLNLFGEIKDIENITFNKNIFAKGSIKLLSNNFKLKDLPQTFTKTSGLITFENLNSDLKLQTNLDTSKLNIEGQIKDNTCNLKINSDKFNLADGAKLVNSKRIEGLSGINSSFTAKYNGNFENIDFNKISLTGKIHSNKGSLNSIIVDDSYFELSNSNFKLGQLNGKFKESPFNINLNISNLFNSKRIINGYGKISDLDLKLINNENIQALLPYRDITVIDGKVTLTSRARNNNVNIYTELDNIRLFHKPTHLKLTLNNGNILLRNNNINLNKITGQFGQMPVFIDGKITDSFKTPNFNLYLNTKPTQEFFDQFFNKHTLYPIKSKGDIILTTKINGTINNLNTKTTLDISENSNIYYMGATLGDAENPVKILLDNKFSNNEIKINNFQYDKIISSQNNKPIINTQLNASGAVEVLDENKIKFKNLKIKTNNPTDAKIFNIVFRKPFMKQGVFTSDLILNGTSIDPQILGQLDITSIDIPFFDSSIKDVNLNFNKNYIDIKGRGTVLTNDIKINSIVKNKLTPPYYIEDLSIKLTNLDVNKITDTIREIETETVRNKSHKDNSQQFDISQLIVKNAKIDADKISVRNINANDFNSTFTINEDLLLDIDNFKFNIAEGSVLGNLKFNLLNNQTNLDIHLNNANALIMSEALFDLKGQVYGSVNGDFNLICDGSSTESCFKTLSGAGKFDIIDGKMPKLGSLEYLLKAGNIFKAGITGLSINGIIDLITPLKTGEFSSISGDMHLANGVVDNINVYSSGNDLNMYMTGSYNVVTAFADMKIFGSLSKNITTVFGKIKNASLSTLFNTIPGINNSELLMQSEIGKIPNIKDATNIYRIFAVDINGDINGDNYVKSFKWVK